jgi:hypothetical protein
MMAAVVAVAIVITWIDGGPIINAPGSSNTHYLSVAKMMYRYVIPNITADLVPAGQ